MSTAPSPSTSVYVHPDADRMAACNRVFGRYMVVEDIYPGLARRFSTLGVQRFAEIGGGRGPIAQILAGVGVATVVVDSDEQMLAEAPRPSVRGDLRALPLLDASVDGVAAVNCLYFLDDPLVGIREAWRVLAPSGTFVASSPSRWNDAELEGVDPSWGTPSTFDAEDSAALVASVFGDIEVEQWSMVAFELPDRHAIADYLHAFNVPDWEAKAEQLDAPMTITKSGAQVWTTRR
ncbi:MAG: class I SAM-dependent methyltransferase [Actinobacteria bacterium]|nr:class I SAM-dependent methyltransferase [Actinomycetota bacterium]